MEIVGWLIYDEHDAKINASFINMLIQAAKSENIELQLHVKEHLNLDKQPHFIWNRSRDFTLAKYFEAQNIPVLNNSLVNQIANNKYMAQTVVKELQIPSIPTWKTLPHDTSFPIVAKSTDGHGGQEVALCHTHEQAQQSLQKYRDKTIFQPFIASNSQDIRVWVLGNEILGAVKRTGQTSFKSNYTLGGTIEKYTLHDELIHYIKKITTYLQSDYIGIDFLLGTDGQLYFNEIEDPVGARSFFDLYHKNLPEMLIQYIKQKVK